MSPELEASILRLRVKCRIALGQARECESDVRRITHLQDRLLGTAVGLTRAHYPDVSQDTITAVAAAAVADGDVRFAVDALEQDRLRLLTGLRNMVEDSRG